jgi:hypothetical protein
MGFLLFLLSLFIFFERGVHATVTWKYSALQAEHHHHHQQSCYTSKHTAEDVKRNSGLLESNKKKKNTK